MPQIGYQSVVCCVLSMQPYIIVREIINDQKKEYKVICIQKTNLLGQKLMGYFSVEQVRLVGKLPHKLWNWLLVSWNRYLAGNIKGCVGRSVSLVLCDHHIKEFAVFFVVLRDGLDSVYGVNPFSERFEMTNWRHNKSGTTHEIPIQHLGLVQTIRWFFVVVTWQI